MAVQVAEHAKVREQLESIVDHFKCPPRPVPAVCAKLSILLDYPVPVLLWHRLDIVGYPMKRLTLCLLVQDCRGDLYFCLEIVLMIKQPHRLGVFFCNKPGEMIFYQLADCAFGLCYVLLQRLAVPVVCPTNKRRNDCIELAKQLFGNRP